MTNPYEDMHKKQNFSEINTTLNVPRNCPGISWKLNKKNGDGDFDEEIVPLLMLLNNDSWHTVASCAGHSEKELENTHKGWGVNDPYEIVIFIHVKTGAMTAFRELTEKLHNASGASFWCLLGYNSMDMSNDVERNCIPFKIVVFARTRARRDALLRKYEAILKKSS